MLKCFRKVLISRPPVNKLYGPLSMTPACEDNYGLDSCGLLVLQCSPPVLVIATSGGQLHHCVVVDCNSEDTKVIIYLFDTTITLNQRKSE